MATISFNVNGNSTSVNTEPDRVLLEVLREDLKFIGTRFGCGEGACGACSVLADGKLVHSCMMPISNVAGKSITTIEGLAKDETLHPMQQAFLDEGAFQCAYCTSGMILAAIALLDRKPHPTDDEIKQGLNGNMCRCCAHPQIIKAVKRASIQMAGAR